MTAMAKCKAKPTKKMRHLERIVNQVFKHWNVLNKYVKGFVKANL